MTSASSRPALAPRKQRRALDQLVPGRGVEPPRRDAAAGVVGPADPLQEGGEAARRADLADQLDRPDVDAELERGGRDQRPQVAAAQPGLDPLPAVLGQAAVVRGDQAVAEPLAQLVRDPLGHPPGVDEDERGPVLVHVAGDEVDDLGHLLGRRDRAELVGRAARGRGQARAGGRSPRSSSAASRRVPTGPRPLRPAAGRRRRSAAGWPTARSAARGCSATCSSRSRVSARCEPRLLPATAWISSTMTVVAGAQHRPPALGGHQQVQRLRRGDQEVRRLLQHRGALGGRGVPGPDRHLDRRRGQPSSAATAAISASGRSRFCEMSTASAFSGDT